MYSLSAYIPQDRLNSLAKRTLLPASITGTLLFADLTGYTSLVNTIVSQVGDNEGVDELTNHINRFFCAFIDAVHAQDGCVMAFGGDAITAWFSDDNGLRAIACGLSIVQSVNDIGIIDIDGVEPVIVGVKVAVASGFMRRLNVGDPSIQFLDIMTGEASVALNQVIKEGGKEPPPLLVHESIAIKLEYHLQTKSWITTSGELPKHVSVIGLHRENAEEPYTTLTNLTANIEPEILRPWLLQPIYERLESGNGRFLAELRTVTVLFLHFDGLDYVCDESVGKKLDQYIKLVQKIAGKFGGYLIKLTIDDKGSYLLVTFGAPLTHDNPTQSAAAAALELCLPQNIPAFITTVQMGLSRGRILAGAFGNERRAAYDLLGDEVSLANRLMKLAQPSQIITTNDVAAGTDTHFQYSCIGAKKIKGLPHEIQLYQLQGKKVAQPVMREGDLVGRKNELLRFQMWQSKIVASGKGLVVQVEGAAGVGKSSLVSAFAHQCQQGGFHVSIGRCESITKDSSYHPWRQQLLALLLKGDALYHPVLGDIRPGRFSESELSLIADEIGSTITELDPSWQEQISFLKEILQLPFPDSPLSAAFGPQERRVALTEFVVVLICKLASQQPLLVIFEDIQWMDEASQFLMVALARATEHHPILMVQVMRPLEETEAISRTISELRHLVRCEQIFVKPFSDDNDLLEQLVVRELGGSAHPLLLDLIRASTHGIPYYVIEFVELMKESNEISLVSNSNMTTQSWWVLSQENEKRLRQTDCLVKDDDGLLRLKDGAQLSAAALRIPTEVDQLVIGRLGYIPSEQQMILKVASVIGYPFSAELLTKVHTGQHDYYEIQTQLMQLGEQKLLTPVAAADERYQFNHQLTQMALYDALPKLQRQSLHGRVGDALEILEPEAIELLAEHFHLAQRRDKQLQYLGRAAFKSQKEYANQTALNFFNKALAVEQRAEWLQGKVEVLHILGDREEERNTLSALASLTENQNEATTYLWAQHFLACSQYGLAHDYCDVGLEYAREHNDGVAEAKFLNLRASIARRTGAYEEAVSVCNEGIVVIESHCAEFLELRKTELDLRNTLGNAYRQIGKYPSAINIAQGTLQIAREHEMRNAEADALNILYAATYYQNDFAVAERYLQQQLAIWRTIGNLEGEGTSLYNLSLLLFTMGEFGRNIHYIERALNLLSATGNKSEQANLFNIYGMVFYQLGDLHSASEMIGRGLSLCKEIEDEAGEGYLLCNLGILELAQRQLDSAKRRLQNSILIANTEGDKYLRAMCISHLAVVYLKDVEYEKAIERSNAGREIYSELKSTELTTLNLTTCALAYVGLGNSEQAIEYAQQAFGLLQECNAVGPEFPERDYFACYKVFHHNNRMEAAAKCLLHAKQIISLRAELITEPTRRAAYLNDNRYNREIMSTVL